MNIFKKLAIAAIPALSLVFASAAQAQSVPQCYPADVLNEGLRIQEGETPTGDVAKDKGVWATLEMYADRNDGSWSLVGKPNEEGLRQMGIPPGTDARCLLLGAHEGFDEARNHPAMIQLFGPVKTPAPAPKPAP